MSNNAKLIAQAREWVDHYDSPGGDPTATPAGPRYGTLEDQANMARRVLALEAAEAERDKALRRAEDERAVGEQTMEALRAAEAERDEANEGITEQAELKLAALDRAEEAERGNQEVMDQRDAWHERALKAEAENRRLREALTEHHAVAVLEGLHVGDLCPICTFDEAE